MKLPIEIIELIESESENIEFGHVSLDIFFRYGKPRFEVGRKKSLFNDTETSPESNKGAA